MRKDNKDSPAPDCGDNPIFAGKTKQLNKKWLPLVLVVLLGLVLLLVRRCSNDNTANTDTGKKPRTTTDPASEVNRNRGFDRRISFLEYTRHADCRMECRHITKTEVEGIMRDGRINYSKSNVQAKPCPEYALEGETADGQRVRIVFAQCDFKTKVVTAIDLGTDWECSCPGDDKKHQNKR